MTPLSAPAFGDRHGPDRCTGTSTLVGPSRIVGRRCLSIVYLARSNLPSPSSRSLLVSRASAFTTAWPSTASSRSAMQ